jgi:hypothetical protein
MATVIPANAPNPFAQAFGQQFGIAQQMAGQRANLKLSKEALGIKKRNEERVNALNQAAYDEDLASADRMFRVSARTPSGITNSDPYEAQAKLKALRNLKTPEQQRGYGAFQINAGRQRQIAESHRQNAFAMSSMLKLQDMQLKIAGSKRQARQDAIKLMIDAGMGGADISYFADQTTRVNEVLNDPKASPEAKKEANETGLKLKDQFDKARDAETERKIKITNLMRDKVGMTEETASKTSEKVMAELSDALMRGERPEKRWYSANALQRAQRKALGGRNFFGEEVVTKKYYLSHYGGTEAGWQALETVSDAEKEEDPNAKPDQPLWNQPVNQRQKNLRETVDVRSDFKTNVSTAVKKRPKKKKPNLPTGFSPR